MLAVHPGRRIVARCGVTAVKAFSEAESEAWEREVAGLRALDGSGMAPPLVGVGDLWCATGWLDGIVPLGRPVPEAPLHRSMGASLVALHAVDAASLPEWSVTRRLQARLVDPPATCPPHLAQAVAELVRPRLDAVVTSHFVHGDWGTSNVLAVADDLTDVVAIIDFEDSHVGDPAEDFKWQVLAGPGSDQYVAMAQGYAEAGGDLGADAAERLVVAGAELCLDVLGWDLAGAQRERFHRRCISTLEQLVAGDWPDPPPGGGAA